MAGKDPASLRQGSEQTTASARTDDRPPAGSAPFGASVRLGSPAVPGRAAVGFPTRAARFSRVSGPLLLSPSSCRPRVARLLALPSGWSLSLSPGVRCFPASPAAWYNKPVLSGLFVLRWCVGGRGARARIRRQTHPQRTGLRSLGQVNDDRYPGSGAKRAGFVLRRPGGRLRVAGRRGFVPLARPGARWPRSALWRVVLSPWSLCAGSFFGLRRSRRFPPQGGAPRRVRSPARPGGARVAF